MLLENLKPCGDNKCYLGSMTGDAVPTAPTAQVSAGDGIRGVVWPTKPSTPPQRLTTQAEVRLHSSGPPTRIEAKVEWSTGFFEIYVDVQWSIMGRKSSKRVRELCRDHWTLCWKTWVYIAQIEVAEYNAWWAWIERTEGV